MSDRLVDIFRQVFLPLNEQFNTRLTFDDEWFIFMKLDATARSVAASQYNFRSIRSLVIEFVRLFHQFKKKKKKKSQSGSVDIRFWNSHRRSLINEPDVSEEEKSFGAVMKNSRPINQYTSQSRRLRQSEHRFYFRSFSRSRLPAPGDFVRNPHPNENRTSLRLIANNRIISLYAGQTCSAATASAPRHR